jgi:hypothetical protein
MEGFGLPMSFGKKTKAVTVNIKAKLDQSKRSSDVSPLESSEGVG